MGHVVHDDVCAGRLRVVASCATVFPFGQFRDVDVADVDVRVHFDEIDGDCTGFVRLRHIVDRDVVERKHCILSPVSEATIGNEGQTGESLIAATERSLGNERGGGLTHQCSQTPRDRHQTGVMPPTLTPATNSSPPPARRSGSSTSAPALPQPGSTTSPSTVFTRITW